MVPDHFDVHEDCVNHTLIGRDVCDSWWSAFADLYWKQQGRRRKVLDGRFALFV